MDLCSLASGSSGNCIYVGTERTCVLIDMGVSAKMAQQGLASIGRALPDIQGILVTHEHSDHIRGIGVAARKLGVPIYATAGSIRAIKNMRSLGAIDGALFQEIRPDVPFSVGDLHIRPFRTSHDAADPVAYRMESGGKSAAVVTDLGTFDGDTIARLQGLDAILLEANHDVRMLQAGSYPYYLQQRILGNRGHLSNENAGRLLNAILHDGMRHICLGHLSQENNYEQLAIETVRLEIDQGETPYRAGDFPITVARRDGASERICIE